MIYFLFNCLSQLKGANAKELGRNIGTHIFSSVNTNIADMQSEGVCWCFAAGCTALV